MYKKAIQVVTFIALVAAISACSSTKKKEDATPAPGGDTTNDASVTSKPLAFTKEGSDSGSIEGLYSVHFDYDSANISGEAKKQLADDANWIKQHSDSTVQVEGHCDERGSIEYNLALGERRAKAVKQYLTGLGVDGKKLTIISYGKEKPVDKGDSEESMAKNRRANFVPISN